MSDAMEPLDPDLHALLVHERRRPPPTDLDTDALLRSIHAAIDAAPTPPVSPWWGSGAAKTALVGSFVVGALGGGAGVAALRSPSTVTVERVVRVPVDRVVERVVQVPVERVVQVPVERVVQAPPARPAPGVGAPSAGAELALIDQATAALARGRHDAALTSLREHLRRFPAGALVEERERLWIDALLRAGQRAEASARAARFLERFPESVHRARVSSAITPAGAP
ncbi:MAG: hypothetical protein U0325_33780 [Polyangiales bacterium]